MVSHNSDNYGKISQKSNIQTHTTQTPIHMSICITSPQRGLCCPWPRCHYICIYISIYLSARDYLAQLVTLLRYIIRFPIRKKLSIDIAGGTVTTNTTDTHTMSSMFVLLLTLEVYNKVHLVLYKNTSELQPQCTS